jgi:methyltransferase (TIGR00027 family)
VTMSATRRLGQLMGIQGVTLKMPSASNLMSVARLRYIQSIHEASERRNPDLLVRYFIPVVERWRLAWMSQEELSKVRMNPFYYYLVARTKYYDQLFCDAAAAGVQSIVNVGCGSDTRSYRFMQVLRSNGVTVLECDQPEAVRVKQRIAKRWQGPNRVDYLPIDLNDGAWPDVTRWLDERPERKTLVLMEGVSPYVEDMSFKQFLLLLAGKLTAGSLVAYDFKIRGFGGDLGRNGRTKSPFRLPSAKDQVTAFHEALGLRLERLELSVDLCARLLPSVASSASLFSGDVLVQLRVNPSRNS